MAKDNLGEIGRSGLLITGGQVYEEFLPQLRGPQGRKVFREMSDNDPVIGGILLAFEKTLTRLEWRIEAVPDADSDDLQKAKFVQECWEDMDEPWSSTLNSILSNMIYGWSYHEVVYKQRKGPDNDPTKRSRYTDGKIGWRKWASRSQESLLRWETDDYGDVTAMTQFVTGDGSLTIPFEKALLFRTTTNRNNPEGRSLIRNAYRPWYFKKRIEEIEAIGIERDLAGLPVAWAPAEYFFPDASADQKALMAELQKIVQNIKRNEIEGVVFPLAYDEGGHKKVDLTLLTTGGQRQFDTDKVITRYNQQIAMSLLADFLMLGHENTGTQSLGEDKLKLWMMAVEAVAKGVTSVVNEYAIPRLLKINGMDAQRPPLLVHGEVTKTNLLTLGSFLYQMVESGVIVPDRELEQMVRGVANLTPIDDQTREDMGMLPMDDLLAPKGPGDGHPESPVPTPPTRPEPKEAHPRGPGLAGAAGKVPLGAGNGGTRVPGGSKGGRPAVPRGPGHVMGTTGRPNTRLADDSQ